MRVADTIPAGLVELPRGAGLLPDLGSLDLALHPAGFPAKAALAFEALLLEAVEAGRGGGAA